MKKIAVAGAGAVGSLLGGYLREAGEDVTLIGPSWLEHIQAIRQHGLIINGCRGKHLISVKALHASELNQLEESSLDILFLAVKSNDTERVLNLMLPYLKDDVWVVSCQNGINTDVISNIVRSWHTIGCVLRFGMALWEPGHVAQTGGTENYPSMLQNIIKGRPTEIDWLNGYVIRRGKEAGIPTPANEVILSLVKEIEDGKLKYSPANISTADRLIMAGR